LPDFREETIYFLLTAQFYDGDPSNNFFCRDRIGFNDAGAAQDPHWRGDFKGLIQRLDYIRDLGFLDHPPIENRSSLDYHATTGRDRPAVGIAGRHLPGPDQRRPRVGHQNYPGRGRQPLLPVRHPG